MIKKQKAENTVNETDEPKEAYQKPYMSAATEANKAVKETTSVTQGEPMAVSTASGKTNTKKSFEFKGADTPLIELLNRYRIKFDNLDSPESIMFVLAHAVKHLLKKPTVNNVGAMATFFETNDDILEERAALRGIDSQAINTALRAKIEYIYFIFRNGKFDKQSIDMARFRSAVGDDVVNAFVGWFKN